MGPAPFMYCRFDLPRSWLHGLGGGTRLGDTGRGVRASDPILSGPLLLSLLLGHHEMSDFSLSFPSAVMFLPHMGQKQQSPEVVD